MKTRVPLTEINFLSRIESKGKRRVTLGFNKCISLHFLQTLSTPFWNLHLSTLFIPDIARRNMLDCLPLLSPPFCLCAICATTTLLGPPFDVTEFEQETILRGAIGRGVKNVDMYLYRETNFRKALFECKTLEKRLRYSFSTVTVLNTDMLDASDDRDSQPGMSICLLAKFVDKLVTMCIVLFL
ncbi:UPF0212 protein MM_2357 [Striga asiatica]|uniref:UPF0212 protein MM_2357 n=1 Tax=Striga asiatica TaxID=4170 RepID=A0A5A7QTR4_STRAF|nr:UPF0212 protein MM_2357 [Striga asiatica]